MSTGIRGRVARGLLALALALGAGIAGAGAATLEVFSLSPAFTPFSIAGRTVTIRGVGFRASTTVKFDAVVSPTVTFIDSRTLTAVVPTVAAAKVSTVTVTDSVNGSDTFYPFQYSGPVFFVATTGLDTNAGTTPTTPFRTIGKGLTAATSTTPTEVRVAAGTYVENNLTIQNDSILSCGWAPGFATRDPEANISVIDGNRAAFVIRTGGLATVSVIDGCTIIRGLRDGFGGGGFVVTADSPVVNNSVFVGNASTTMGGAIYSTASTSYGAVPTFSNNVIIGNRAYNKQGGGIVFYSNYNPQPPVRVSLDGNVIVGNRSFNSRGGGFALTTGSYVNYNAGKLVAANNMIGFNRGRSGAGFDVTLQGYSDYYQISLNNNLIFNNSAPGLGGGLSFQGAGTFDGYVRQSTIANNVAGPAQGAGFAAQSSVVMPANFVISDLVLWANNGGDTFGQVDARAVYSDSGTLMPGAGNISVNPAFASGPLGNFYLRQGDPNSGPDSPAVNAGSASAVTLAVDPVTTRNDLVLDGGLADMGFHYAPAGTNSPAVVTLSRLDPSSGDFGGSEWVLLRGAGFDPGAVASFDGVNATRTIYLTANRLIAQPAAHVQALVNARVTDPDTTFSELASAYRFLDNEPPVWSLTVGVQSAVTGVDCQRSVVLDWNDAVDTASNPVVYEIYREDCIPSGSTSNPCANFGYVPSATDFKGTTLETTWVDTNIPSTGQDPKYVYAVRARDSASTGTNKEWNFAKRVSLASSVATDTFPPSPVGNTLTFVSPTVLDWTAAIGATQYGMYRTTAAALYASPGTLVKLATLTKLNNDFNGDLVTDSQYTDATVPALNQVFFYKVSALDVCNVETTSELGP
ncbi:MAG: IPT/TIG domain-containing protein [Acidobacteria bacterium]|nr:IPT/TIG domain-containing protein [Acidobacteriota bacterium]